MDQPKTISSGAIKRRKYFTSWATLVFLYFFIKVANIEGFWSWIIWIIGILSFLWNIKLSKVAFTRDKVYFDNKEFDYTSIIDAGFIEINQVEFFVFKTDSKKWNERYFTTEFGQIGFLGLIKLLLQTFKKDETPLEEFFKLLKEKSSIDPDKFKKD